MLDHIKSIDELEKEALSIDKFLNITCSEDANEAVERGNDLQVYIARTGKMLADAKYWQDLAIRQNMSQNIKDNPGLSPSIRKDYVNSLCQYENFMVTWIDRMNRAATHQSEWLRTVISKAKAEIQQTPKYG